MKSADISSKPSFLYQFRNHSTGFFSNRTLSCKVSSHLIVLHSQTRNHLQSKILKPTMASWVTSMLWDAVPLLKSYGRRAPSGGQRVEEGGRENKKRVTTNIVDEKVDMFAFGVLVLEVITSRRAV
ncbi:hypothetical protein YC2023_077454 [Brassica napus]|uniref:(rape) hypothetical protein n=1 Tax=Brassica napus TaxID=3708 RepID=A0A816QE03_BRANA|nr:unnamed protein product [Brassica napus]